MLEKNILLLSSISCVVGCISYYFVVEKLWGDEDGRGNRLTREESSFELMPETALDGQPGSTRRISEEPSTITDAIEQPGSIGRLTVPLPETSTILRPASFRRISEESSTTTGAIEQPGSTRRNFEEPPIETGPIVRRGNTEGHSESFFPLLPQPPPLKQVNYMDRYWANGIANFEGKFKFLNDERITVSKISGQISSVQIETDIYDKHDRRTYLFKIGDILFLQNGSRSYECYKIVELKVLQLNEERKTVMRKLKKQKVHFVSQPETIVHDIKIDGTITQIPNGINYYEYVDNWFNTDINYVKGDLVIVNFGYNGKTKAFYKIDDISWTTKIIQLKLRKQLYTFSDDNEERVQLYRKHYFVPTVDDGWELNDKSIFSDDAIKVKHKITISKNV